MKIKDLIRVEAARKTLPADAKSWEASLMDAGVMEGFNLFQMKNLPYAESKAIVEKWKPEFDKLAGQDARGELFFSGRIVKVKELSRLTFGQFVDLENILKTKAGQPYAMLPDLLGVLLNDEKDDFAYENKFNEIKEQALELEAAEVLPVINFTLLQGIGSLQSTLPYLEAERRRLSRETMNKLNALEVRLTVSMTGSVGIMGGMRRFATWPVIHLTRWMRSSLIKREKSFIS